MGKKAVARRTLDDGRIDRGDQFGEVLRLGLTHSEDMKGKALGLASANPGEFFKMGDELVERGHT